MGEKNTIIIADDHSIARLGLGILCRKTIPEAGIVEVQNVFELHQALKSHPARFLILDLFLENNNTLITIPDLLKIQPGLNILVVTMGSESVYGNRVIKAGAKGFINKTAEDHVMSKAISRVYQGKHYISEDLYYKSLDQFSQSSDPNPFNNLTNKEMEIAQYLIDGLSNGEIGGKSNLAPSTISTFKMKIFSKLNVKNVIELSELASVFRMK
jgi:two-component system invasion response regulator UvrY